MSPLTGTVNQVINFTATGANSSLQHELQYKFNWGDNSESSWGSSTQSHTYTSTGQFTIQAEARCEDDNIESTLYSATVTISDPTYTLTVNLNPPNGGTVSLNPPEGSYTAGTQVTLTAMPNANYTFGSWSGADPGGSGTTAYVTMGSANRTVTANFNAVAATLYTLTVTLNPANGGTVTLSPPGGSYAAGTPVTLTVMPNANYTFGSWSGVDTSSGTTAYVTMGSSNRTVTANLNYSGGVPPPPSGALGTVTNPYKINKLTTKVYNGYIPEISLITLEGRSLFQEVQSSILW